MAYCSEQDVKNEFKDINWVNAPGGITASTITEWTEQESAFIDTYLGSIYLVPVTGPKSLLTLKKICILLTSSRVKKALQVKNLDPATQNQGPYFEYEQAMDFLERLQDGEISLPDAPLIIVSLSSQKVFHNMVPPVFKKTGEDEEPQW
jgi:phage gp36-like protein